MLRNAIWTVTLLICAAVTMWIIRPALAPKPPPVAANPAPKLEPPPPPLPTGLTGAQRDKALKALRTQVPASQVPDARVTVLFWTEVEDDTYAGGYLLGADRSARILWDNRHQKLDNSIVEENSRTYPGFFQYSPKTDEERHAFQLAWGNKSVPHAMPVVSQRQPSGAYRFVICDGWESCGHWDEGVLEVDGAHTSVKLLKSPE